MKRFGAHHHRPFGMILKICIVVLLGTDVLARSLKWDRLGGKDLSKQRKKRWDIGGSMPGGDGGSMPGMEDGGWFPSGESGGSVPGGDNGGSMPGMGDGDWFPGGDSGTSMPGGDNGGSMPGGDTGGSMPGGDGGSMPGMGDGGWFPGGDSGGSLPGGDTGGSMPGGDGGSMPGMGDGGWFPGGDSGTSMPGGDIGGSVPGGDGGSTPGMGDGGWLPGDDSGGSMPGGDNDGSMPGGDGAFPGSDGMGLDINPFWIPGSDYGDNGWQSENTNNGGWVPGDYGNGGWVPGDYGSMPGFPDFGSGPGGMPGAGSDPGGMPGGGSSGGWFPGGYTTAPPPTTTEDLSCGSRGGVCSSSCDGEIGVNLQCETEGQVCCLRNVLPARCGDPNGDAVVHIVGGSEADAHSWPWQVSLQSNSRHFCGGSLINNQWIVTAAHCVGQGLPEVVLGDHDQTKDSGREISRTVIQKILHENYTDGAPYPNDIALLKLSEPVSFSRFVYPACLPEPGTVFDTASDECWISGWGDTRDTGEEIKLNELEISLTPRSNCSRMWGSGSILNTHVCVGDGKIGACNGDSGGPLSCKRAGDPFWSLAGATSWGYNGCQTKGFPNVYTRVSEYKSWIIDNIRRNL